MRSWKVEISFLFVFLRKHDAVREHVYPSADRLAVCTTQYRTNAKHHSAYWFNVLSIAAFRLLRYQSVSCHNVIIIIIITIIFMVLSSCSKSTVRVHSVHVMNTETGAGGCRPLDKVSKSYKWNMYYTYSIYNFLRNPLTDKPTNKQTEAKQLFCGPWWR